MKKLINLMIVVVVGAAMLFSSTGCASYMVYKESSKQVAMRKALITNNQEAIKALQLGGDTSASGIAVGWMEAIAERPWLQLGAGGVDALVAWGAYEGVKSIDGGSGGSDTSKSGGRESNNNTSGENTTIIQGDGNTVTVSGSGGPAGSGTVGQLPTVQP